jgi:cytochrome c5
VHGRKAPQRFYRALLPIIGLRGYRGKLSSAQFAALAALNSMTKPAIAAPSCDRSRKGQQRNPLGSLSVSADAIMRGFLRWKKGARMSANENHSHESPIKTPKQLVIVVVLAFIVPIIVIVLLAKLATSGRIYDKDSPAMSPQEVTKRIRPVAEVGMGAAGPGGKVLKTGEEVYRSVCMACHATGISKAPKFGDRGDWARRLREGQKALVRVALKGRGAMPPRGGASDLTDIEVERAVVYMANAAAGKFKEPSAPTPAAGAAAGKLDGKKVYESTCMACHGAGVANAPKFGDKKAWAPHLEHGVEHLYEIALKGKGAMPPKGGNLTLSNAEVRAALDYMLSAVK